VIDVSTTVEDQQVATQVARVGTDARDAAKAFLADDLEKGAVPGNKAVQAIPAAKVALGCP